MSKAKHNIYRDGKIHLLSEECTTCIFKPATRPVDGSRVAGMVKETMDTEGATVVCHSTLYPSEGVPLENAICRGWWDRLAYRDPIMRMAVITETLVEVPPPAK